MKKMIQRIITGLSLIPAVILIGCSGSSENTLYLYNWSDYVKEELVEQFTEETGIEVIMDYFDSNEAMYAKLRAGASGYDLIFPTTYMVEVMNQQGMLAPIDHKQISHIDQIDPQFLKLNPDTAMDYSVPYMISATGIGYQIDALGDPETISWDIFGNAAYKGRMTLLNDYREAIGAALKFSGYSYNTVNPAQLEEAKKVLIRWKKNLAKFENDQYKNGLASGEFTAAQGYSGDILQVQEEAENVGFLIPSEGTTISIDNMVIPADAKNKEAAHQFINFMLRPEIAAENIEYVYYLAPNLGAYDLVDEEVRENPAVFLSEEVINNSEVLLDLGEKNLLYSRVWDEAKAAQ